MCHATHQCNFVSKYAFDQFVVVLILLFKSLFGENFRSNFLFFLIKRGKRPQLTADSSSNRGCGCQSFHTSTGDHDYTVQSPVTSQCQRLNVGYSCVIAVE